MPTITDKPSVSAPTPTTNSPATNDARARAIAKLTAAPAPAINQSQAAPVLNPTAVTPEEMTGNTHTPEEKGQFDTTEATKTPILPEAKAEEPAKAADPATDPLSKHYSALARKEKQLRAKVQEQDAAMRTREEAMAAREAAIKAKEQEYETGYIRKDSLKADPFSSLQEAGLTYDQLTEMALQNPQDARLNAAVDKVRTEVQAQIKAMRDEQEKANKAAQDERTNQYKQAVEEIRTETKRLVYTDPEFETIKAANAVDDVVDLIEQTFKEDKILLTVQEAAKQVEDYLVEEAVKIAKLKKIQSRLHPKQESTAAAASPTQAVEASTPKQPQMKTLTNAVGANRPLSAKERAILAFKGDLKN